MTAKNSAAREFVTIEPPKVGSAFPMRLPQVDADGNETAGIKMPATAVPAGDLYRMESALDGDWHAGRVI
jgi:hypothetical protein